MKETCFTIEVGKKKIFSVTNFFLFFQPKHIFSYKFFSFFSAKIYFQLQIFFLFFQPKYEARFRNILLCGVFVFQNSQRHWEEGEREKEKALQKFDRSNLQLQFNNYSLNIVVKVTWKFDRFICFTTVAIRLNILKITHSTFSNHNYTQTTKIKKCNDF